MKKSLILLAVVLIIMGCAPQLEEVGESGIPFIDTGIDSETWITIPAGVFFFGSHNHQTEIGYDYDIMLTDVTNAQYAKYLNEALAVDSIHIDSAGIKGYQPGEAFFGARHELQIEAGDKVYVPLNERGLRIRYQSDTFTVVPGFENHPVAMVTFYGAKAYAEFYGYRLPSEKEWEKAARGTDTRPYPWGDEIARNQANYYSSHDLFHKLFAKRTLTTPVGFYNGQIYNGYKTLKGVSPYGLYDMAGNVWQWCGDDYPDQHLRYMRGGSQANYEYNCRVWARNSAGPEFYGINIGFRCVRGGVAARTSQKVKSHN